MPQGTEFSSSVQPLGTLLGPDESLGEWYDTKIPGCDIYYITPPASSELGPYDQWLVVLDSGVAAPPAEWAAASKSLTFETVEGKGTLILDHADNPLGIPADEVELDATK